MLNKLINYSLIINIIILELKAEYYDYYKDSDVDESNDSALFQSLLKNYFEKNRGYRASEKDASWNGRWFPESNLDPPLPPKIYYNSKSNMIPMGVKSVDCDDGKTNLTVDWDYSPIDYTCYQGKIEPDPEIDPKEYCEQIPKHYVAMHKCMQEVIEYKKELPLFGTHRPIWPVYGEYKFLPRQRWLHSLEHGAVVMLYHPCANPLELNNLKKLVTGCMRRHIISPSNFLSPERPLALLTWGCRLTMSYVIPEVVQNFILTHALKGPEMIEFDGDFDDGLIEKAKIVSDMKDSTLCHKELEV